MSLRAKVLLPLSLVALLLLATVLASDARSRYVLPMLAGISLLLIGLAGWTIKVRLLRPRERLKEMLRRLIPKEFAAVTPVPGQGDEFTTEMAQISGLVKDYEARLAQESARREKLQQELRVADELLCCARRTM